MLINTKLESIDFKKSNKDVAKQLFDILKQSKIYKTYYDIGSTIELIELGKLDDIIPEIVTEYNKATNKNKSKNKVVNEIIHLWNKTRNKLETKLPKIVYKYINDKKPNRFFI